MDSHHPQRALSTIALLALACGGGGEPAVDAPAESALQNGTAIIAISGDVTGVNPLLSTGRVSRTILDAVFLRLFAEQPDFSDGPPSFEPRLAKSWSWSEEGRRLSIELRRDASWSDGAPVTSADVVWSLDAASDPDIAWVHSETHERIVSYRALDEYTIEVRFRNDYPGRLSDLNESPILPKHLWSRVPFSDWRQSGGWFRDNLVGSGPFVITSWKASSELILEPNPHYYRKGYPKLARLVFQVVPDRANRLELLLSGQVDFVSGLRPSAAPRVTASETVALATYWNPQYLYIVWNGCEPPFDDSVVRRAMTLVIDREALVEAVYGDHARVAFSPMLSDTWVSAPGLEPWPWNPKEAKRLLASRGFTDTDGDGLLDREGRTLSVQLSTNPENEMRVDMVSLIHGQLRDVGVAAEIDLREFSVLMDDLRKHEFEAGLSSWIVDTTFDLKSLFHSSSIDAGQNFGCYRNPEVDRLIDLARDQTDLQELRRHLIAVQEAIHRDQPYTFLAEVQRLSGVNRRLQGVVPNPLATYGSLEEWSLAARE